MSCVWLRVNLQLTESGDVLANCENAASLTLWLAPWSSKSCAREVPLRCCPCACGGGKPASSAMVGNRSTASTSAFVAVPAEPTFHGARITRGMWVASSKFVILAHVSCSPSCQP